VGFGAHVKDQARFPSGWAFFNLGTSAQTAKPLAANSACQTCHLKNGAVDNTFVQFLSNPASGGHGKGDD
jgi:hypothetical protein